MKHPLTYIFVLLTVVLSAMLSACGKDPADKLDDADRLVNEYPDSAYAIIRDIDYNELGQDSLKAKYILTRALANSQLGRSLITDTLLGEATVYFRGAGDTARWVTASQLLAEHDFITGNPDAAMRQMEEMLPGIKNPELLRDIHVNLFEMAYHSGDYGSLYRHADWLMRHADLPDQMVRFGVAKGGALYYQGEHAAALATLDSIIATGILPELDHEAAKEFYDEYAEILDGSGHSARALAITDSLYRISPPTNDVDRVFQLAAVARLSANAGNIPEAKRLLDSVNFKNTRSFFELYSSLAMLKAALDFKETGRFPSDLMHEVSKNMQFAMILAQYDRQTAMESVIELSEDKYELRLQRQRLWLLVTGISLVLIIVCITVYFILSRRRKRLLDAEERTETLERMLREAADTGNDTSAADREKLRAALLRQLGIFKIFAGTPTQQSREALKKISAIGSDGASIETMVDWPDFYQMIDNLYDGFHSGLLKEYPGSFNDKEQQIIVLLKAGFSTKEIGVLTEQSSATIYTRKSVIRKKLGTPENGDPIATIENRIRPS